MTFRVEKRHIRMLIDIFKNNLLDAKFYDKLIDNIRNNKFNAISIQKEKRINNLSTNEYIIKKFNEYIIELYEHQQKYGQCKKIIKIINNNFDFMEDDIQTLLPNEFCNFDSFVIIGCPDSTDIDVIVFVSNNDISNGKINKQLRNSDMTKLRDTITNLGYSPEREIDYNLVYVDPLRQTIIASSKGGIETQNIILATWKYHNQIYDDELKIPYALKIHPIIEIEITPEELYNKALAFAKFVLEHAEDICIDYKQQFRPIKMLLYSQGGINMMKFMECINKYILINFEKIDEYKLNKNIWKDRFKSIIMKLIQIILIFKRNDNIFIKNELALSIYNLFDDDKLSNIDEYYNAALWFLYRGKLGNNNMAIELFNILIEKYIEIVNTLSSTIKPIYNNIIQYNVLINLIKTNNDILRSMDDKSLHEFLMSPETPTEEFKKYWINKNSLYEFVSKNIELSINTKFIIKSTTRDEFINFMEHNNLYENITKKLLLIFNFTNQRSLEWLYLLNNKYICGSNSAIIDNTFEANYNLMRGAIVEALLIHLLKNELIKFDSKYANNYQLQLGFIMESDNENSRAFAPDMILLNVNNIVPEIILIELKCLKTLLKNSNYMRAIHLATKQLRSGCTIIRKNISESELIINEGLIILASVQHTNIEFEIHRIKIS